MTAVNYTAQRSIAGGHSVGESYSLDLALLAPGGLQKTLKRHGNESISLGGQSRYVHYRVDIFYQCATIPLNETQRALMAEFLDSVLAGEPFLFDPDGTSTVPVSPRLVQLDGDYSISRSHFLPALYQFVFKIRTDS